MTRDVLARIAAGEILISDGAMGTLLMEHGLPPGGCPELFNAEAPGVIESIARLYSEVGADIVHTNTFGGSPLKLALYDLEDRTEELNGLAVAHARKGVGEDTIISLSIGPTGKLLKPFGDLDPQDLFVAFLRQIKPALEEGADMITVETMTDLVEAEKAVKAAKELSGTIPVMATMTFEKGPRGFYTIMGTDITTACEILTEAGADILGSNCGNGTDLMIEIAREFRKVTDLPIAIQANAGVPVISGGETKYPETPNFMAQRVTAFVEAGVSVIGGCCGTTPDHIREIRNALK
jgi:5-methyltetrahydrofolate--homocysteine methyltransferase